MFLRNPPDIEALQREDRLNSLLDLGTLNECPGVAKGIDAKFRIAKLLDLEINCVNMFKHRIDREL